MYSASRTRTTSGCIILLVGFDCQARIKPLQFKQAAGHVVIVGDEDDRPVVMRTKPGNGFSGIPDRVLGLVADIDTAIEKLGFLAKGVAQRFLAGASVDTADQQPFALVLAQ